MTEQNSLNNDDNYQSFNNPQKTQYSYLFVSEQQTQNEYNIENNIPFSNEELNEQFLSSKRKIFQIIFSIILYIFGLLFLFVIYNLIKKNNYLYFEEFIFIYIPLLFKVSSLDIILASMNVYYTKKFQNSRNTCASIILGFLFFILLFTFFCSYILIDLDNLDNKHIDIIKLIIFLNFIFSIILFFFNSKSKCCKCFN